MLDRYIRGVSSGEMKLRNAIDTILCVPEVLKSLGVDRLIEAEIKQGLAEIWAKSILETATPEQRDALLVELSKS